ncbi:MAG: hypothetical protein ABEL76_03130 [Bradymonadaceae bacterium]
MRRLIAITCGIAVVGWVSIGGAQDMPEAGEATGGGGQKKQYKEKTVYDFQGDDVTGDLVKPDEANIQGEQHGKTSSLIDIRSAFVPEMMKTVEDL